MLAILLLLVWPLLLSNTVLKLYLKLSLPTGKKPYTGQERWQKHVISQRLPHQVVEEDVTEKVWGHVPQHCDNKEKEDEE